MNNKQFAQGKGFTLALSLWVSSPRIFRLPLNALQSLLQISGAILSVGWI